MLFQLAQQNVGASADTGAGGAVGGIIGLAIAVVIIVAMWQLFSRAGRPGWASIIPIYNTIVLLQITGKSGWWILGFMVPFLNFFVLIRMMINLAQVFGKGVGFGLGVLFLPFIFIPILAFSGAPYVGPGSGGPRPVLAPASA